MKILIWVICYLVIGAVRTVLQNVGIVPGGFITLILFWVCWVASAISLCSMWDVKQFEKEAKKQGMTIGEYAKVRFKSGLLQACRENLYEKSALKKMLKNSVKADVITKSEANVLFYIYNKGLWAE